MMHLAVAETVDAISVKQIFTENLLKEPLCEGTTEESAELQKATPRLLCKNVLYILVISKY